MNDAVREVYQRWARTTRRGWVVRCNRTRKSLGPVLFPTADAARRAADELGALPRVGRPHAAVECSRGRHWHVRPVVKEVAVPASFPMPEPGARDGDAVRAAARRRIGLDAGPPATEAADCTDVNCDACRKAARQAARAAVG